MRSDSAITEVLYRDTVEGSERRLAFLLRSVSTMLAIVYLLEAVWLSWRTDGNPVLFRFAVANAIFFGALRVALAKVRMPKSWSQPLAGIATLLPTIYALVGLKISQEPWGTTQLLIVVLMAGFVFTSRAWFTGLVIVACTGWFWTAQPHLSKDAWVQLGGALLLTVIWSMWFLETRLRSLTAFEKKVAEEEHKRVVETTQFFTKAAGGEAWCPVCKGSPDAVIRHDGEKILDANGSATQMFGMSRTELATMAPINLFASEFRADKTFLSLENLEWSEKAALRKDKSRVPVDVTNARVSGGMALVLRDATLRGRARERAAAATERTQLLVRRQAELAQLAKVDDQAANRQKILNDVATVAHRFLPCSVGAFVIVNEGELRVEGSSADGKLDVKRLEIAMLTWMGDKRESVVCTKITDDPDGVRALYPAARIEAYVATPIVTAKGVVGFLLTLENAPREYAPADLDFLTVLAYRAGNCLHG